MTELQDVAAVIRCYNNPNITKQVRMLLRAGVGKVIVVINAPADKGNTRGWLAGFLGAGRKLELIEMHEGYSWSNSLNRALSSIRFQNLQAEVTGGPAISVMLNVSVEALFEREHLLAMVEAFNNERVAVVGTSFSGLQNSNSINLGRSYVHPRNTGMMLRVNALTTCGSFDSWCDEVGGMEDIELVLRLRAFTDHEVRMLDLQVPLVVGVNHHQPTKELREQEAMQKIVARMQNFRPRIESVIKEMQLEG